MLKAKNMQAAHPDDDRAHALFQQAGERMAGALREITQSELAAKDGDLQTAATHLQRAIDASRQITPPRREQLEKQIVRRALELAQNFETEGDASRAAAKAQTRQSLEQYQMAAKWFAEVKTLHKNLKEPEASAFAALGMARCLVKSGAWYRGLEMLQNEILPAFRQLGNLVGKAQAFHQIGFVHQLKGDYELAEMNYQDAIRYYRQAGEELHIAQVKVNQVHLAIQMQELDKAISLSNEVMPVLQRENGSLLQRAEQLFDLARKAKERQAVLF